MKIPISYNLRSMWQHRLTTILTIGGISLVVFIFTAVLMMANGLEETLQSTGSENNVVVLRKSATTEVMSAVSRESANLVSTFPEIATDANGKQIFSRESLVIINLPKKSGKVSNVMVRGVTQDALTLRPEVKFAQGRMLRSGTTEIVVGQSLFKNFANCQLDSQLQIGNQQWKIVGIFSTDGSATESEIWGDLDQLMNAFGRDNFSSLSFRIVDVRHLDTIKERVESDKRLKSIDVKSQKQYYQEQSFSLALFIRILGIFVTVIFSVAAMMGAMITMYSAVANRTRIIGTLRVLGFRRGSILFAFLIEAMLLSLFGGVIGIALASGLQFFEISTLNSDTYTETAFRFQLSMNTAIASLIFALTMGVVGGFLPAVRAARIKILDALRA